MSGVYQRRRDAAAEAGKMKVSGENESEETSSPADDDNVCRCSQKSEGTSKRKKAKGCPIGEKDAVKFTKGSNFDRSLNDQYLIIIMRLYACYLPMLNDSYVFEEIFMAAISGRSKEREFMQLIDEHGGVRMDHRDSDGSTILMLACVARPHSSVAIDFVLSKASKEYINAVNHDGLAALHFATLNYLPEVVEKLLALGADPNAGRVCVGGRYFGLTPLLISANTKHGKKNRCLQALLNYDADISVQIAKPVDDVESLNFRLECKCGGCNSREPTTLKKVLAPSKILTHDFEPAGNALFHSVRRCIFEDTSQLLDKCEEHGQLHEALKEPTSEDGLTVFAIATKYVHPDIMKDMVERDPSVVNQVVSEYRGKQLMTPLHMALSTPRLFGTEFNHVLCGKCMQFSEDFVMNVMNALLDAEYINLHARNGNQETPIMLAVKNGHDYVTEKMLNLGADPFTVDEIGNSPVSLAMSLEPTVRLKMYKILFKTGLSHEIYKHNGVSMVLHALLHAKDLELFQLFCRAGAINCSNRMRMYKLAQSLRGWPSRGEKDHYLKALSDTTPPPLQEIVTLRISGQVGLLTPKSRALALEYTINNIKFIEDNIGERKDDDREQNKDHNDKAEDEVEAVIASEAEDEMGLVIEEEAEDEMEAVLASEAEDEMGAVIEEEAEDEVEAVIASEAEDEMRAVFEEEAEDEVKAMIASEAKDEEEAVIEEEAEDEEEAMIANEAEDEMGAVFKLEAEDEEEAVIEEEAEDEEEAMSVNEADSEVKAGSEEKAEDDVVAENSDVAHNAEEENFWKIFKYNFREVHIV